MNKIRLEELNKDIPYKRIKSDYYGNPRYVVHYLDLELKDYVNVSQYGLKKYRGKDFGGGYVIQSYNLESDLTHILKRMEEDKLIKL